MNKEKVLKATHEGTLPIGNTTLSVAVLDNGMRIITQTDLFKAFGRPMRGSRDQTDQSMAKLPGLIDAKNLKPFISIDLIEVIKVIEYENLKGKKTQGYNAIILPLICEVYIDARTSIKDGKSILTAKQIPNYEAAKILMRALYKVSIIALVDEATGYQYDREKFELQAILRAFISDDILEWQKTFHLGFYKEIFRLWGVPFTAQNIKRKPPFIGMLTNELIYKNLPKGSFVLKRLKEKTPKTEGGNYKVRLHQSLTPFGKEELKKVLYSVESLAVISESKPKFKKLVQERYGQREIPFPEFDEPAPTTKKIEKPTNFDKTLKGILSVPSPPKKEK